MVNESTANQMFNGSNTYQPQVLASIVFFPADVIVIALLTAIILIGVPGNVLVVVVFGLKRSKVRTRFESFLMILACIDLFSLLIIPSSFFYLTATKFSKWHFGTMGCKILPTMLQVSVTVSHGVLLLISFERHRAIVYPFDGRISNKTVTLWMLMAIMTSLILAAPYMSTFEIIKSGNNEFCAPSGDKYDLLLISSILQLSRDFVCLFVLASLGIRMHKALTRKIAIATWNRASMSTKGRKVLKVVIVVFTVLTLPLDLFQVFYYSISLLHVTISDAAFDVLRNVNTFLNILQMSNSVVNVFIYSKLHSTFTFTACCKAEIVQKECRTPDSTRSRKFDDLFASDKEPAGSNDHNYEEVVYRTTRKRKYGIQTIIILDSNNHEEIIAYI